MTCTPNPGQCASLSFNNNNQIVGDTYDADGNLLYDGANTFTYDAEGRVTSVVNSSGTTKLVYDAAGRQAEEVAQRCHSRASGNPCPGDGLCAGFPLARE